MKRFFVMYWGNYLIKKIKFGAPILSFSRGGGVPILKMIKNLYLLWLEHFEGKWRRMTKIPHTGHKASLDRCG